MRSDVAFASASTSPDPAEWVRAHGRVAEKWDGRMAHDGRAAGSWRDRALRAEAEAEAARVLAYWKALELEVRARRLQADLDEATGSLGWKLTRPLRRG